MKRLRGSVVPLLLGALMGQGPAGAQIPELRPVANRLPAALAAGPSLARLFVSPAGTVVGDGTSLTFYDPSGSARVAVDLGAGHRLVASASTADSGRRFFVVTPRASDPTRSAVRRFEETGEETAGFTIESRSSLQAAPGGAFLVASGTASGGTPALGERVEGDVVVAVLLYSADGDLLSRHDSIEGELSFHDLDAEGRLALSGRDSAGRPSLRVVRADGEVLWRAAVEPPERATELIFAESGAVVFERRWFNDLRRPLQTVVVRDPSGEARVAYQSERPLELRRAGGTAALVREVLDRGRSRFHLLEGAGGGGTFEVELRIQDFAARPWPGTGSRDLLAWALTYTDDRGTERVRLQQRSSAGALLGEQDLEAPLGSLRTQMLAPWQPDGRLVPTARELLLLEATTRR